MGVDYLVTEGDPVYAPISGKLYAVKPYSDPSKAALNGCNIRSDTHIAELYYLQPDESKIGQVVEAGEVIGYAQDVSQFYSPGMKSHIHFEIQDRTTGQYIDPTNLFFFTQIETEMKNFFKEWFNWVALILVAVAAVFAFFPKMISKNWKSQKTITYVGYALFPLAALLFLLNVETIHEKVMSIFGKHDDDSGNQTLSFKRTNHHHH